MSCALLLAIALPVRADEPGYQLGRGWTLPQTDLTLGGYASASVGKLQDQPWSLDMRHLSLFLWWQNQGRLKFFSETDLENALQVQRRRTSTDGAYLALERFYFDWAQSDALKLRLGKFLTPIGRWNLIHADPLVWTTSRPLLTERSFPTNATGAMAYGTLGSLGRGLDYSLYGSIGKELRPNPQEDVFNEAFGLHLSYPLSDALQLGLSYANFEQAQEIGDRRNLVGTDLTWSYRGYELTAEGIWRFSSQGASGEEKGAFLQAVAPLGAGFFAVGRYEYFRQAGEAPGVSLWLGGVDYRWNRALVFKTEYSRGVDNDIDAPEGLLASVAVLF